MGGTGRTLSPSGSESKRTSCWIDRAMKGREDGPRVSDPRDQRTRLLFTRGCPARTGIYLQQLHKQRATAGVAREPAEESIWGSRRGNGQMSAHTRDPDSVPASCQLLSCVHSPCHDLCLD